MPCFNRLLILLAALLLLSLKPFPCRAQPPDLPLLSTPLAPQPSAAPPTPLPARGAEQPNPIVRPSQLSSLQVPPPPGGRGPILFFQ